MKTIKIINNELIEIASYRNPELIFHNSNNPRHVEPEYDDFESYCDFKEIINPFVLYEENQQLKKQKDDVALYIKKEIKNMPLNGCKIRLNDLLRILGEEE